MQFSSFHSGSLVVAGLLLATSVQAAVPVANNDSRSVTSNTPITIDVLSNDTDADGDAMSVIGVTQGPSNGSVVVLGTGAVRYTPNSGFVGTDQFTYTVTDDGIQVSAPATVTITVVEGGFASLAREGNDRSVARALEAACNALIAGEGVEQYSAGSEALLARCRGLRELASSDPQALARAINRIAPEETVALMQAGTRGSQDHTQAISQHLSQVGSGISRLSINGVSIGPGFERGGAAGDIASAWGVFASVRLEEAEKEKTELENSFDYTANAITVGLDYRLTDQWIVGAAVGWTQNDLEFSYDDGEVETTIGSLIGFVSYANDLGSLDLQLGYSNSDFDVTRNIEYVTPIESVKTLTKGKTYGDQYFISSRWQFALNFGGLSVYPYLSLEHQEGRIDRYEEYNAAGFEVNLEGQTLKQTSANLGFQLQYALNFDWGVMLPMLEIRGVSEMESNQDEITGEFIFSPVETETFLLQAEEGDTLFVHAAAGASFIFPHGISAFLLYEEMLDYQNLQARRVEIGIRSEF